MRETFIFLIAFLIVGCATPEREIDKYKVSEYLEGSIKSIVNSQEDSIVYTFYLNGEPESKISFRNGKRHGETTYYHINGKVKSKGSYKKGLAHGSSYFFYESGYLEAFREFEDDKHIGVAIDYYDSTMVIKAIHSINGEGKVYKSKLFDRSGNLITASPTF